MVKMLKIISLSAKVFNKILYIAMQGFSLKIMSFSDKINISVALSRLSHYGNIPYKTQTS